MTKTILIIEDEPDNFTLLRDLLQISGYSTFEATNSKQSLELAKSKKPDLILIAIQMPDMDGLEIARILKADATTANIPILALTSYAVKGDKERILEAGCDGYLAKPFDIQELLNQMARYLPG